MPVEPGLGQWFGQFDRLADFHRVQAGIHQSHALVVHEGIGLRMAQQIVADMVLAPARPEMAGEQHVRLAAPAPPRFHQIIRPALGIAHQRAARREQIVHRCIGIFRQAQRFPCRQIEVHFCWRFGVGGELELDFHPIDDAVAAGRRNAVCRRDQAVGAGRVERR